VLSNSKKTVMLAARAIIDLHGVIIATNATSSKRVVPRVLGG
jgi:hypothetical protein